MPKDLILHDLNEILKLAEEILTYERIFDLIGISDLLKEMYIETPDLSKDYVKIFYKVITDFLKLPLYKNLDIQDNKNIKFLRTNRDFIASLQKQILDIKKKLEPRHFKVLDYILKFDKEKSIPILDVLKNTKLDKASILFILDDLKKTNKIYDYNGREVILK